MESGSEPYLSTSTDPEPVIVIVTDVFPPNQQSKGKGSKGKDQFVAEISMCLPLTPNPLLNYP